MSIETRSKFYYGHLVDVSNNTFIFTESGDPITATIPIGGYSLTQYVAELQNSLNAYGELIYSCSVNRVTRKITITSSGTFALNVTSTGSGISAYPMIGFTSNKSGASTYTSDVASGSEYRPQFYIQDYLSASHNKKYLSGSVKTSGSGVSEIVSFGRISEFEMSISFVTDHEMNVGAPVENNQSGVSESVLFMDYITTKSPIEFMEDRDNELSFVTGFLVSTEESQDGIAYKIKEMVDRNLTGFYNIGKLVFRRT